MATSDDSPSPSEQAMREGMEGLIASMKAPRPRSAGAAIDLAMESTVFPDDGSRSDDALAAAPWDAVSVPMSGADEPPALERGTTIGRLVVIDELGAGGMGVVYAAYDPDLDRKVALKLLRPGSGGSRARERFLREAQALAKLSHPNVVAIHDVGTRAEQVWLTMELVQGQTLRRWLETPRGWPEVVRAMRSAGEGLAAAHAAGLLHRDFKPDNVMLGDDGRVRVMDFGLALVGTPTLDDDAATEPDLVTKATTLAGTPAYMAPEQFVSTELTAAADLYSFCVMLWEALYGERPRPGDAARRREAIKRRRVPSWLRRICERGLAVDPKQRWPSMTALLDALARGRTRARLRSGLVAVGVLAALGAGAEGLRRFGVAQEVAACEASGDEIETAWNDERRQALRDALLATGASYAAVTAEKAMPWLDEQARAWRESRVETCLDARVRGQWDANMLDRSLWCLDERRSELDSLVDELTQGDPRDVLPKVVPSVMALRRLAPCRNEALLEAQAAPSPALRDDAREVREKLVRVGTLRYLGRFRSGLELAEEALAEAQALDWPPLTAAARLQTGLLLDELGSYPEAESALEEAYFEADQGVAPGVPFHAAAKLVVVVGVRQARHAEGLRWGRHADASLAELGIESALQRGTLLGSLASVRESEGAYAEARDLHEQAIAIKQEILGAEHLTISTNLSGLATIHRELGSYDEAKRLQLRLLDLLEEALGPEHPSMAITLQNLANVHAVTGAYEEAKALQEKALDLRQRALGPKHPEVGVGLSNLGTLYESLGDYESAKTFHQRAHAILAAALGPEHPNVAISLYGLANAYKLLGDYEQAEVMHERALAIREKVLGSEHPAVARSLDALAGLAVLRGRAADAIPLAQRAVTILEKEAPAEQLAGARFVLARALQEAPPGRGHDPARALVLAEQARDALRGAGTAGVEALAEVEQWLAARDTQKQ